MRIFTFLFSFLFTGIAGLAQQAAIMDSMLQDLAKAETAEKKVQLNGRISLMYMSVNPVMADSFGRKSIEIAEFSRDRKLMVKAYRYNGLRYTYVSGKKENITQSIKFYQKALDISRAGKMEEEQAHSLLGLSSVYTLVPDPDKALNYATQAFSLVGNTGRDSLESECFLSLGDAYLAKEEKLLALKNYFTASRLIEETRKLIPASKLYLRRKAYLKLRDFFASLKNFDKSLDYAIKAKEILFQSNEGGEKYNLVNDLNYIGGLFAAKEEFELAKSSFNESILLADSLRFETLRIPGYVGLLNMYLKANRPQEALSFMRSNQELQKYLSTMGFAPIIDQSFGFIYMETGQLDSAGYYFLRAKPFFETVMSDINKINFFSQLARYYTKTKNYNAAIDALMVSRQTAIDNKNLEWQLGSAKYLDSTFQLAGDYKQAHYYASIARNLKDSLDELGREEDLLQLQIEDEQQRELRLNAEKEEKKKQRDRFQYLAITIGIAIVFVALVMLGMFRVSATTIRIIGFFAFLMFFEFLFLIFKKNIYGLTNGEPWKDLAFMIGLAALLLPLHHWLEHKVIHYLTSHNLVWRRKKMVSGDPLA